MPEAAHTIAFAWTAALLRERDQLRAALDSSTAREMALREALTALHAITESFAFAVPLVIGPSVQKLRDTVRETGELLAATPTAAPPAARQAGGESQ